MRMVRVPDSSENVTGGDNRATYLFTAMDFCLATERLITAQLITSLHRERYLPDAIERSHSNRASPWLALWYGMVSHWFSGHFLEYSPRNSFSNLNQHYLAGLGLGALLSSST